MSVKPGTELVRLVAAFYKKHKARRRLILGKTLHDPLGLIVSEDVLREVFRTMERPKSGGLLASLNVKHESIMDGPRAWAELGVDLNQVPHFLKLDPIFRTNHTFKVAFDVEPATFVLHGKQISFVEPFHCLELYNNEAIGGPLPHAKTEQITCTLDASKPVIYIHQYESEVRLAFKDILTCEAHLVALHQLRKVCVERMQTEYRTKHGEPITSSELNAKLLRKIKIRGRTDILHNMVVYVMHHLGVYKHNTQDSRYPELIPIVTRILDRWDKDADSLKTEIAHKGDVFNDLLEVMRHLSLRHERFYGKTEIDPANKPFQSQLEHDPAYLVDYLANLTLEDESSDEEGEGVVAAPIRPECEAGEDESEGTDEPKKAAKRPATPEPLRPEAECKKPAAG